MKNIKFLQTLMLALSLTTLVSSCSLFEGRETTGEYIDDSGITAAIKKDILMDKDLNSYEIGVETMKGVVQLSGFVQSVAHKEMAEHIALRVNGVKHVRNNLIVKK